MNAATKIEKLLSQGVIEPKDLNDEQRATLGWTQTELDDFQQAVDARK